MSRPLQLGSAVSAVALAAMLSGCAASHEKTGFGGRTGDNVGLATRALMALHSNDTATAIDFAERAVANTPDDAGFRAILGNAYFKAGRFASAEAAYKDSLTIYSNQPQVILRLALVETALGKQDEAVAFLENGRSVLDSSNYGLALALAGRPADAIEVLETALASRVRMRPFGRISRWPMRSQATGPRLALSQRRTYRATSSMRGWPSGCSSPARRRRPTRSQQSLASLQPRSTAVSRSASRFARRTRWSRRPPHRRLRQPPRLGLRRNCRSPKPLRR